MSILKGAIIFLTGVGVGGSSSYFYFKKKYDEKKEELIELKEHYNKKLNNEIDKTIAENIIEEQKYISYDKMSPETLKETIREKEVVVKKDYPKEAFIIDEEEYSEQELYFDKVELDFFTEDEALIDEADELTDIDTTIGFDILEKFINDENEDIIYIRNPILNTDYMVHKRFGKYSDIVGLGGDDNDE